MKKKNEKKYLKIVQLLEGQIYSNSRLPGSRIPSVRQLSRELTVSIGTVQHAYEILEDKGLIKSKDRSGYYICRNKPSPVLSPRKIPFSDITREPKEINVLETSIEVMSVTPQKCLYQLGSAVPFIEEKTIRQIRNSMKKVLSFPSNSYEGVPGYQELRRQIALRSHRTGRIFSESDLIITSGCQESLSTAIQAVTGPGDLIAVESPCYYGILQTLEILKRRVIEIPVCPTGGMDLNLLEDVFKKHPVRALLINPSFSNPTGYCYQDCERFHISQLIDRYQIILIEDDVFSELGISESRPRSIQSFNKSGNVILCSSFSKTLSQDLGTGWIIPGRFYKEIRNQKYGSTLGTSPLGQYIMADFLSTQNYERHLRYISSEYRKKRDLFISLLREKLPLETRISQPEGGFLCWLKLPAGPRGRRSDSMKLYRAGAEKGLSVTPGILFSAGKKFNSYIRLNYGYIDKELMPEAVEILSELIQNQV